MRRLCQVLNVSPSGYYSWRQLPVSRREIANHALSRQNEAVHRDSGETYGSPRVYQELKAQGVACSENRVARLDQVWLADITYIPAGERWLYLAAVLDLCSRRVVGWSMAERMTGELTQAAVKMALQQRQPGAGLIHHSNQGSQYTDQAYQAVRTAGTWYDNAPMESFFGTLKSELVHQRWCRTRQEARMDVFRYIVAFYNRRRRHSGLIYLSPETQEEIYHNLQSHCLTPCPQTRCCCRNS